MAAMAVTTSGASTAPADLVTALATFQEHVATAEVEVQ
jgi:hypothetical protein